MRFVILLFAGVLATTAHANTEYKCVKQALIASCSSAVKSCTDDTTDTVMVLSCEAATPTTYSLTDKDKEDLDRLQIIRMSYQTFDGMYQTSPEKWPKNNPTVLAVRDGFMKVVGALCERHPRIAILPLSGQGELKVCGSLFGVD
jgi:hypothetical protein